MIFSNILENKTQHLFIDELTTNKTATIYGKGTLGVFLVGGGGYEKKDQSAGSSGFFKYETVRLDASQTSVVVIVGEGGTHSSIDGGNTSVAVGELTVTARGGGGNNGLGWSMGGDDSGDGFSNGAGS